MLVINRLLPKLHRALEYARCLKDVNQEMGLASLAGTDLAGIKVSSPLLKTPAHNFRRTVGSSGTK